MRKQEVIFILQPAAKEIICKNATKQKKLRV
jgi:hypothetical protein